MLIASATVLWGLLFSADKPPSGAQVAWASVLISGLLSAWLLYANHYRQLYMSKLYRMHVIEGELKMSLNNPLGFPGLSKRTREIYGPKGHHIDMSVCVLITAFGPIYRFLESGFELELLLGLLVMAGVSCYVHGNEKKMIAGYEKPTAGA